MSTFVQEPLTTAMLAAAPMQEQKQMLGERIFPLIQVLKSNSSVNFWMAEFETETIFHLGIKNWCPSTVFIISLGRTCSPPVVSSGLHMFSHSASTVSGQARSQECCWRSTTRNCSTCSRILPVFRQRYCVYCCFYHTRVISKYEKRNVLFVGG